jgi:hypothetical protein
MGVVPDIATRLMERSDDVASLLNDAVVGEVPAFTASGNPDVLPELERHLEHFVAEICHLLAGRSPGDFAFVREHAICRAAQKFPLDAELATYRHTHRILVTWIQEAATETADQSAQLRRVIAAVAEFASEYVSAVSTLLTSEYVSQTRIVAESEGDRRTELLNLLLSGYDESDARAAQLLRRAGYLEQRQSFCVAVARSVNPQEMVNTARAERMVNAMSDALRELPVRVLSGIRDNQVVIVMSGTRRLSGWTAPQSLLAERVYPQLRTVGPAALIGLSTDAPSTSHIPAALSEARIALDFANVADRVMPYAEVPFCDMLVRVGAEQMRAALPTWVEPFLRADKKAKGRLRETLHAYANADMNALKTAKALSVHPNTIYARMQRINDISDRNPLIYRDLTELLLATDCALETRSG